MKTLFTLTLIAGLSTGIFSQPLNGSYTIGGNVPDFTSPQDAANALKVNGISGPVFFNIRPGIYMKNGGNNTVLTLDSIVAGLSESNRVTFQPDDAAGGNVGNTILQMNITDPPTADARLVLVGLDFISFKNITFQESDASINTGNCNLVQLQTSQFNAPTNDGIVFEGCRFIGTEPTAGTENGIELGTGVSDITVRGNTFLRLLRGISGTGTSTSLGTFIVEDNQFLAGWRSASGSGNPLGCSMEIFSRNLIIRRNTIDFNGSFNSGYHGIFLFTPVGTETIIVEQNSIEGSVSAALIVQGYIGGFPDSLVIVNNMINVYASQVWANEPAVGIGVLQNAKNAKIFFNTVVARGNGLAGLIVNAENSVVLNNIIITEPNVGFNVCYQQGNSSNINFQSDYNVIFMGGVGGPLVIRNGVQYPDLGSYVLATGLDTNSISRDLDFVDSSDVHISDCQAQDPDLIGIPVAGITVDIDDETRSTTAPMIGSDENSFRSFNMFADPFRAALPGTAFDIASDNFDNILYDGLAVPDYDNRQVLLYHNLPPRSFELDNTLPTSFKPIVVKFYDLDEDNNLDLIVGGDTTAVQVFWGDGVGGFSTPVTVETFGRVRSLEPGPTFTGNVQRTMIITEDNGFVPDESTIGYLMHLGSRNLCHDLQYTPVGGGFSPPDTVHAAMKDFVVGEFAGDGNFPEIAAVTSFPLPHPLILINDVVFLGSIGPCGGVIPTGNINEYQLGGVGATAGQSNIVTGDFDGDTDLDLITLETFSSVKFIRNQGNLNFTTESISVAGAQGLATMDYENDGDLDFITVNDPLDENGITVFLNDGFGNFTTRENCFFPFATGLPRSVVASDFDQDGKTDIAIVSSVDVGVDSLFVIYNLGGGTVGVGEQEIQVIPTEFSISQNYPNPFNPSTKIEYTLPVESNVKISVFNILGEKVRELVNTQMPAGAHALNFNASNLASGIYIYIIEAKTVSGEENFITAKKMVLLK